MFFLSFTQREVFDFLRTTAIGSLDGILICTKSLLTSAGNDKKVVIRMIAYHFRVDKSIPC